MVGIPIEKPILKGTSVVESRFFEKVYGGKVFHVYVGIELMHV